MLRMYEKFIVLKNPIEVKLRDDIDRKSTAGFVIRMFGNIIYWKAQKQKTVTKNSTFASNTLHCLKRQQKYYL